jgi:N-acetylmuramoyl-L-alanine amidase
MKIKQIIANVKNYLKKKYDKKWLVAHFTANDGDNATNNGKYFKNNVVKASAHYFVDDDTVVKSVEEDYVAYAVGGKKLKNTKGAKYHGVCTNYNSISIELCDTVKDGKYNVSAKTRANAVELAKDIVKRHNIDKDHVIRHYDVTGKNCPKYYVEDESAWLDFKDDIFATKKTTITKSINTNASVVKSLQKALNSAYKLKLDVDGKLGPKTKTTIKTYIVKNYTKNAYAKWIQQRLKAKGYKIKVDGKFGADSTKVLKQFQKDNKLTADGKCGYDTCIKLI